MTMRTTIFRLLAVTLLGAAPALALSCGSSTGLIPAAYAGPLQSDFEEVARLARAGNGSCGATAAAIRKTERDFQRLPATIDRGLRLHLEEGIANLRERAQVECAQPSTTSATATSALTTSAPPTTTTAPTTTTTNTTTTTTSTSPPASSPPPAAGGAPPTGSGGTEPPSGEGDHEPPSAGETGGEEAGGIGEGGEHK